MKKLFNYLLDQNVKFAASNTTVRIVQATKEQSKSIQSIIEEENLFISLNGSITATDPYKEASAPKVIAKKK